ncbi:coenzyme F420-reducing hydrogenase alpha subunit [Oikeobacillus pervagus]|uniref:Coenzyme F420-reducing hydrogenase alpha subunit n=1 Tax=Oikeobacillus pervagus TaxID=1325931 RepID=A0AAJ1T700_9BACI|nr:YtzC family protein [Oikeobacillus pervagus]MDQ0215765.1 coenzyme F420-reducing hydrogenase alpha subunit [Oikeobacillus pervagus]
MATRDSMDQFIQRCEDVFRQAQDQYKEGHLQGHYHDEEYTESMQQLEELYNDLLQLYNSANSQQREMLDRKRFQLQQLQNNMILLDHDRYGGRMF